MHMDVNMSNGHNLCLPSEHCSVSADVTNVEAELLQNTAGDPVQVLELQARIKELEMEQSLMQRELDNMSDVAQRTDNQLRYAKFMQWWLLHGGSSMNAMQEP